MANISRLTPTLWTGGDLPPDVDEALDHLDDWADIGVGLVVDNRLEWSDQDLVADVLPALRYVHNGVDDAGQRMPDSWFDIGVGAALEAWAADPDTVVVAHCHMGINRGPSLAYALLLGLGWDPIEAIDLIRTNRPSAAVGYAEDALGWHLRRSGASAAEATEQRRRLRKWRRANPHDTIRIIRAIRADEAA